MSNLKSALLPNRGVVRVGGPDAKKLLQGILTNDMDLLDGEGAALHSGLLTPQGKILFDFFVVSTAEGYLLEIDGGCAADLVKRLTMYKLRADAAIQDVSANYSVAAIWGEGADRLGNQTGCVHFTDPRHADLGLRLLMGLTNDGALVRLGSDAAGETAFDAHRIALGVPQAGKDFPLGDTFPHEALYDQLNGVSFTKGCFVGQEVVSRMQHRGTARKRVVQVVAETGVLPESGAEVRAGEALIGTLGSTAGERGLALLRLDRAASAKAKGDDVMVGDVAVAIEIPKWAAFTLGASPEEGA